MAARFVVAWTTDEYNPTTDDWDITKHLGLMNMEGDLQIEELPIPHPGLYVDPVGIHDVSFDSVEQDTKYVVVGSGDRLLVMGGYDKPSQGYINRSATVSIFDAANNTVVETSDDLVTEALELVSEGPDGYAFSYQNNVSFSEGGVEKVWFRLIPNSGAGPAHHFTINMETGELEHVLTSGKDVTFMTENLMVADESRYELSPSYDIYARANDVTPVYAAPTYHYIALISRDEGTAVDLTSDGDRFSSILSVADVGTGTDVPVTSIDRMKFRSFIAPRDSDVFSAIRTPLESDAGPSSCLWFNKNGDIVQEVALEHKPLHSTYYAGANQSVFVETYDEDADETFRNIVTVGGDIIDLDYKHPAIDEDNRAVSTIEVIGTWMGSDGNIPNNFWTAFHNTNETI